MKHTGFIIFVATQLQQLASAANHRHRHRHRHHLLDDEIECKLIWTHIAYVDPTLNEESWGCMFTKEQAQHFGGDSIVGIEGIPEAFFEEEEIFIGETGLRFTGGAFIERSTGTYRTAVVVPKYARVEIVQPHASSKKTKVIGTHSVLVVRVIDAENNSPNMTVADFRNDLFEDSLSLKSQFATCSYNQLIIEPADIGNNGVVEMTVDAKARDGFDAMMYASYAEATANYDIDLYDFVMFCFPDIPELNLGTYQAWATYWDGKGQTFYNNLVCGSLSFHMHEIGHNLNLAHSGKIVHGFRDSYGDMSSYMGYSYLFDDAPQMCFNAANNYHLGWYSSEQLLIDPLVSSVPQTYLLKGINRYTPNETDGKYIVIGIQLKPEEGDAGYYIGYNRKAGLNNGTMDGTNTVMVHYKRKNGFDQTWRYDVPVGDSFRIYNFWNSESDVVIKTQSISSDLEEATILISKEPTDLVNMPNWPSQYPTFSPTTWLPTDYSTTFTSTGITLVPGFQTIAPTLSNTETPSETPTASPTDSPTLTPTAAPTDSPTLAPTAAPTKEPTPSPTKVPKKAKAPKPTKAPKQTKAPKPTKAPKQTKAPKPTKAPKDTKTRKPANTPKETKTPKSTKAPKLKSEKHLVTTAVFV